MSFLFYNMMVLGFILEIAYTTLSSDNIGLCNVFCPFKLIDDFHSVHPVNPD